MFEALTVIVWVALVAFIVGDQYRLAHLQRQRQAELHDHSKRLQEQPSPLLNTKNFG
jgi:hypothetical protein